MNMADTGQHIHDENGGQDDFMRGAMQTAQINGACVLEWFTCANCHKQQCASHAFREGINCSVCGEFIKSVVPRLPETGQVTGTQMIDALRRVRAIYPTCQPGTAQWIERLEGAVKCAAIAYGCFAVHQALNQVEEVARALSGGHRPPGGQA